ncbi:short-chain dehydrogenase [Rhodanobacter thiooxydans]|uniref:Short-chain dehydrogenase n=1 Tax=Rhodanobacter thiooxydans TaxID=416169 RepID=A0A154QES7_9GAMM|nr:SDR family oxidoreductase [Rhodanobacter thiooxydans]KZC22778.1 short-chain dehydrogenase [Rhodanobacter thiooxydans]MCW0202105.1 SDR family oxidoreductase [Rhodanobacter thiooxydans]
MAASKRTATKGAKVTAERQRAIQAAVEDNVERKTPGKDAAQQPAPKTGKSKGGQPPQHQQKPGREQQLDPRPQFLAPTYAGSGKLAGMAALITGGDSGIGRAVAVLFAREGADVAIVYLNEHADAEETRDYVEGEGQRCLLIPGDVRDLAFCLDAVAQTVEAFGKLSVLVNNAAFQEHADSIEEISEAHFDETLRTNLYGYFHMAKAASPHLGSGCSIINTGSETGLFGNDKLLDYSMTKGGIHAFTKALAANMVTRGIRVNAVAPGPVWTPLNPADQSAERLRDFGKSSAMGRPAQPEELAPAYVFLAAPSCASYISGAVLPVMGGPTS